MYLYMNNKCIVVHHYITLTLYIYIYLCVFGLFMNFIKKTDDEYIIYVI